MEEVDRVRDERLKAWVAALAHSGPVLAAPVSPPSPKPAGDIARIELFSSWEAWVHFLTAPPAIPALARVLDCCVRIAAAVDVRVPVLAPDIVAAITQARQHRQDTAQARDSLVSLKILAVTDTLQHLYSCVRPEHRHVDLDAILRESVAYSPKAVSRTSSFDTGEPIPLSTPDSAERASVPLVPPHDGTACRIGMPVQFQSVLSLGHTEPSAKSLGTADSGRNSVNEQWGEAPQRSPPNVVPSWSTAALNAPSPVEQAAGSLYSSAPVDDVWVIGESIGVGNFSNVHHCTSVKDGTRAAIKVICKGAPDLFVDDICREVAAFSQLGEHDSIVKCLQVLEDDRFVYIVMELLTGGQLLPRVADSSRYGQFSEAQARDIARNIARALAHCHALSVAHRDVKPENILFASRDDDTIVKITDFGIAHILPSGGVEDELEMVGTPLYVAPEVLLQKPYGCAADMWSLGVIVHILLTGFPPFDDDNIVALINKVKTGALRFEEREWQDVSPMAKEFCQGLLKRNPRERLTAAQAMLHPWLLSSHSDLERSALQIKRISSVNEPMLSLSSRQASLQSVQTNLATFVKRRDSRPQIGSSHKLSLLVSLSERKLKRMPSTDAATRFDSERKARAPIIVARGKNGTATRSKSLPQGGTERAPVGSPRRRVGRKPVVADQLPVDVRMNALDHSEFRRSYSPPADANADTKKLHEMGETIALASSPRSVPVRASVSTEAANKTQISSLSTTTSGSSSEVPSSPKVVEKDAMDQSNVHLVRIDESLRDRREADVESPHRSRSRTRFMRQGNRKGRRRQTSLTALHIFRRSDHARVSK